MHAQMIETTEAANTQARVLLVDSHRLVSEGLRVLLEEDENSVVVGCAADGIQALELAMRLRPEVVVTEVTLPSLSGIEVTRRIVKSDCGARVLILSSDGRRASVEEALRAGASGYVLKSDPVKLFQEAIAAVRRGEAYLSPGVAHHLVDAIVQPGDATHSALSSLTSREREILQLIAEGRSSKEVATSTGVSLKTVESHRANIMAKLGIHKVAGLVRLAVREGLVEA